MPTLHTQSLRIGRYVKGVVLGLLWKARGVRLRDRVAIEGATPDVYAAGRIALGSRILFRSRHGRSRLTAQPGARLSVGDRCFVNSGVVIDASLSIEIGAHCLLGDGCQIRDSNYHEIDEGAGVKRAPVVIGRNVWIGINAILMPGVSIGDHSVVGANAVVTQSVPPRSLVAGNPARVIREITASDAFVRT